MAEALTTPQRTPEANLPISMRGKAADMLKPVEVKVPTLTEIIAGSETMIGGMEIPTQTVEAARNGDQAAQNFILQRIDVANAQPKAAPSPIAGTKIGPGGEIETDLPDNLTERETGAMEKYIDNRKDFFAFMNDKVVDSRVRDLLIDHYSTGEFFRETARQYKEIGRFIGNTPNYLYALAMYAAPAAAEASIIDMFGGEDITFSEAWAKRQPQVAQTFAAYRSALDKAGVNATYEQSMNEFLKDKFIEKYGQEAYEDSYVAELEGLGTVENPMLPLGFGQEILDFGFRELPVQEQGLSFLAQNLPVAGVFGALNLAKGGKQAKRVEAARRDDPNLRSLDDVTIIRQLEIQDKKTKFTRSWRKMTAKIGEGFGYKGAIQNFQANQTARKTIKRLDQEIEQAQLDLSTATNPQTRSILEGTLAGLTSRRNRLIYNGASNPFLFNLAIDEGLIAIGQTAGLNIVPAFFGEGTEEIGELAGALGFAFGGRPATRFVVGGPFKLLGKSTTLSAIGTSSLEFLENVRLLPKGVFTDASLDEIQATLGRRLTTSEIGSFNYLIKAMKNFDVEQREQVYGAIENYNRLRERIIGKFAEGPEREQAEEAFKLSFAHVSGLAPLQALEVDALKKTNVKNLEDATKVQMDAENSLEAAMLGMSRLRQLINDSTGINSEDSKFLTQFVTNFERAADAQRLQIEERKIQYLGMLRQYKNEMLTNPDTEIGEDIVHQLSALEIQLVPGAVADVEMQRSIILKTSAEVADRLNRRAKIIADMRGTPEYLTQLGKLTEDIYDAHMSSNYALARNAYTKADELVGDTPIDISPFVNEFAKSMGVMQDDTLAFRGMFSPQSAFFNSRSGRNAFQALNDMSERSLRDGMQLDDAEFEDLKQWVTTRIDADTGDVNEDYLGPQGEVTMLDMAIHFSNKSRLDENTPNFEPFKALPFEVDELKRHFTRMAMGKEGSDSLPFTKAALSLDDSLKTNPEVFAAVQGARDTYRDLIFDSTRPDSLGEKIVGAASGPEFVTKLPNGRKRPYYKGQTPENWHKELGVKIAEAANGDAEATRRVADLMNEMIRFWGDRTEGGEIVFDLTTERGRAKFENVASLIRANLYEHWGEAKAAGLNEAIRRGIVSGKGLKKGTYNFNAQRNLVDNVAPLLNVKVINKAGETQELPLLDLRDMVTAEQDIVDIMTLSDELQKKYKNFEDTVNDRTSDISKMAQTAVDLEQRIVKNFEQVAGTRAPRQFYEQYVETNDIGLVRGLKENYINTMIETGMDRAQAEKEFNQGMVYMITNGLVDRAGVTQKETISIKAMNGQRKTIDVMTNAAQIVADLENPNVLNILEEFIDPEHISFLKDIGEYMMYAGGTGLNFASRNQIRGVSPNELISRAFNIARGMVSPTYVAAEFAFRLMSQYDLNAITFAAQDKEMSRALVKVLEGEATDVDLNLLVTKTQAIITRHLIQSGDRAPSFVPQAELSTMMQSLSSQKEIKDKQKEESESETVQ